MLRNIPFKEYLELDYVNKHQLDDINHSIRRWLWNKKCPREPTEAMIIGSATHTAVLEPDLFEQQYAVAPRKAGKAEYEAFVAECGDRIPLKPDVVADINAMSNVVRKHPVMAPLLGVPHIVEGTAIAETFGVYPWGVKVRPDLYVPTAGIIVDLKTARSVNVNHIKYAIKDFRYHVQAALYIDVMRKVELEVNDFIFVFVEKNAPNDVYCVRLDKASIALGRIDYLNNMDRMFEYYEKGDRMWTGPLGGNEVQEVGIV